MLFHVIIILRYTIQVPAKQPSRYIIIKKKLSKFIYYYYIIIYIMSEPVSKFVMPV